MGVNILLKTRENVRRPPLLFSMVDLLSGGGDFLRHEDILGDRQIGKKVQLLKDNADALGFCLSCAELKLTSSPRREQDPVLRALLLHASQNFHQGGFTGPVLAHQYIDLAAINLVIDVVQRLGSRERPC